MPVTTRLSLMLVRESLPDGDPILGQKVSGPVDVFLGMKDRAMTEAQEVFWVLLLDTKNVVRDISEVTRGTINGSLISPGEIFKRALLGNAASIVCVHNHPSGDPRPSPEDIQVTKTVMAAGRIMGIPVLDHIIIGDDEYVSIVEMD